MSFSMCVSVTPIELTMNDDSYSCYDSWQTCRIFKTDPMQDSTVRFLSFKKYYEFDEKISS